MIAAGRHGVDASTLPLLRQWNASLADAGWAAPAWPSEYGGRDADVDEQLAYVEEMSRAEAPGPVNVIGVSNIAPAIMTWGTPEQRERFLTPMLRGDEVWSQGMSEPDAGSDLASLRTAAVADGDGFVISGQKTWNSLGHLADWCQLYVRTDPSVPKHKGISCFIVDMRTPGVEVRPVRTITGETSFAEVFLSDVRVPAAAMLGPLNEGWRVAMTTLSHERAGVAKLHLALGRRLSRLRGQLEPIADPVMRDRFAFVYSRVACMRWMTERALAGAASGAAANPAAGGSLAKLAWSRAEHDLSVLAVDAHGLAGLDGEWATFLASARQASIAGGTTEINRNIVAEQGLGLPR